MFLVKKGEREPAPKSRLRSQTQEKVFATCMKLLAILLVIRSFIEFPWMTENRPDFLFGTWTIYPTAVAFFICGYLVEAGYHIRKVSLSRLSLLMSLFAAPYVGFRVLTQGGFSSILTFYFFLIPILAFSFMSKSKAIFITLYSLAIVILTAGIQFYDLLGFNFHYEAYPLYFNFFDFVALFSVVAFVAHSYELEGQRNQLELESQQLEMITASKMASLGRMAAGIAHEINNPICIIEGAANQIRRLAEKSSVEDARLYKNIDRIEKTTRRIANVVESMKRYSGQSGKRRETQLDLRRVVMEIVNMSTERFRSCGVALEVDLPDEDVQIIGDPTELYQVFLNLFNNAFDAVKDSTLKDIRVNFTVSQEYVDVRVQDSGPGVPEEIQDQIMEPFFTTKELGQGTGIGLNITKKILENHDGSIRYARENDLTTFVVTLPRIEKKAA